LRSLRRNEEAADAYRSLIESTDDRALADAASLELVEFLTSDHHDGAAPILGSLRSRMGEMNPQQRARAFYQIGMAAHRNEQWKEAADALGEFLELSQDQSLAHASAYFHGDALIHLGRHEAASRTFRTILESGRDSEYVEPAMLRTGECATALQHWPIAEQSFRNFLDRYPKSPQAYQARFGVGWARENQRQYGGAISAYRELIESHQGPTSARAQFQIGECLFAQEQWEEAARELLKVDILYAYPEWSAAALFEAGKCFERLQKPVQARDQYDQVLERFSDTQWGSMARQRRAKLAPGDLPGGLVRQGHD
jgi:TolA-binding protein